MADEQLKEQQTATEQETTKAQQNNNGITETELNAKLEQEKQNSINALLKDLGVTKLEDAKDIIKKFTDNEASKLDELGKEKKRAEKLDIDRLEVEKRLEDANTKLSLITNGVQKDLINDMLTLVNARKESGKTVDTIIAEMKKDDKYQTFFVSTENNDTGTNRKLTSERGKINKNDYGKMLADKSVPKIDSDTFFK